MDEKPSVWNALSSIEAEVIACHACPRLVAWREQVATVKKRAYRNEAYWGKPVPGFGDPHARLMVVGLAPGAHGSNRTGRMFTGDASGKFLYPALYQTGFASQPDATARDDGLFLHDLFITAVCRCVPPDNKPTSPEMETCRPYLEREATLLPLQGIVALGKIAYDQLFHLSNAGLAQGSARPSFSHGAYLPATERSPWVLASYHPSQQNTLTGRLTFEMFQQIWERARDLLRYGHEYSYNNPYE